MNETFNCSTWGIIKFKTEGIQSFHKLNLLHYIKVTEENVDT